MIADDSGEGEEADGNAMEKSAEWIAERARSVAENGVGPITCSVDYAHTRLTRAVSHSSVGATTMNPDELIGIAVSDRDSVERQIVEATINRIVKESMAAVGTTGFVTGLGGLPILVITIPADIASNFVINARMVGAIAHLRGYDLKDPHTQAMFLLTVAGSSGQAMAASFGVKLGREGAKAAIKAVPISLLREINKRAGFYLVAKYGTKRAAVTLVKAAPFVGGVVSGGVNVVLTASIGKAAKGAFPY